MQGNLTIVGVKRFEGEVEGVKFNHTKLLVLLPFPRARAETNRGFDVVESNYGKQENFEKFQGLKFPAVIDAEYEVTTKGLEVFEAKLVQPPKQ